MIAVVFACASYAESEPDPRPDRFLNAYLVAEDAGERAPATYFLRRAWVQITRDLERTEVPPTVPLDLHDLARRSFAVSWLGHSSMLLRVGSLWVLVDPVLSDTAGPWAGVGPARLTPLPIAPDDLPQIDVVLISHDHYDHLDEATVRRVARQASGPPRFFVGKGLRAWFDAEIEAEAEEFGWWDSRRVGDVSFSFVPAQHSSGRSLWNKNATLWGGWVVEYEAKRFYFAGDTAYAAGLFSDIRARVGAIDLAAIPIGAYQPREWMRYEHLDPNDAVQAHLELGAPRSFGVHWATFQLGDEEPFQPARDLDFAVQRRCVASFGLLAIGAVVDVWHGAPTQARVGQPAELVPVRASDAGPVEIAK